MIPAFQDAKCDKSLRDLSIVVYLHVLDVLDPTEFREVKRLALATKLGVSEKAVQRAMQKLVRLKYLRRRRRAGEATQYQLVYSRIP